MIRDNFTAGLMSYANTVATENPEAYKVQVTANREAGMPIISHDNTMLQDAYASLMAEQLENELRAKAKADQSADVMPEPSADKQEPIKEGKKRKSHRTLKAQAEKPAMRVGQSPADVPADQSPDTSNADHTTPEREPTKEPALVS
jgi:hypothetical protein